jgi:hypothetical protein
VLIHGSVSLLDIFWNVPELDIAFDNGIIATILLPYIRHFLPQRARRTLSFKTFPPGTARHIVPEQSK